MKEIIVTIPPGCGVHVASGSPTIERIKNKTWRFRSNVHFTVHLIDPNGLVTKRFV